MSISILAGGQAVVDPSFDPDDITRRRGMSGLRGYFGVGVYHPKYGVNVGTLWRTAHVLGGAFLFTIGRRYQRQASDTLHSSRHLPLYHYADFETFRAHLPYGCRIVGVELTAAADLLDTYQHPPKAVYLLGAEDQGLPQPILRGCHELICLRGRYCLNVATAGSIVIYHRTLRQEVIER